MQRVVRFVSLLDDVCRLEGVSLGLISCKQQQYCSRRRRKHRERERKRSAIREGARNRDSHLLSEILAGIVWRNRERKSRLGRNRGATPLATCDSIPSSAKD
jgi:hypothetical protein